PAPRPTVARKLRRVRWADTASVYLVEAARTARVPVNEVPNRRVGDHRVVEKHEVGTSSDLMHLDIRTTGSWKKGPRSIVLAVQEETRTGQIDELVQQCPGIGLGDCFEAVCVERAAIEIHQHVVGDQVVARK